MSIHGKIYLTLLVLGITCLAVSMAIFNEDPDPEGVLFKASGYGFYLCLLAAILTTLHHIWSL